MGRWMDDGVGKARCRDIGCGYISGKQRRLSSRELKKVTGTAEATNDNENSSSVNVPAIPVELKSPTLKLVLSKVSNV